MNSAALVSPSSKMRNNIKSMCSYLEVNSNGKMNNNMDDIKQFFGHFMLKSTIKKKRRSFSQNSIIVNDFVLLIFIKCMHIYMKIKFYIINFILLNMCIFLQYPLTQNSFKMKKYFSILSFMLNNFHCIYLIYFENFLLVEKLYYLEHSVNQLRNLSIRKTCGTSDFNQRTEHFREFSLVYNTVPIIIAHIENNAKFVFCFAPGEQYNGVQKFLRGRNKFFKLLK